MRVYLLLVIVLCSLQTMAADILQIGNSHTVGSFGEALYATLREETGLSVHAIGLGGASATTYSSDNEKDRTIGYGFVERTVDGKSQKVGAKPVKVKKLSTYIDQDKPKTVIIELGDNFANYKRTMNNPVDKSSDQLVQAQVAKILQQLEATKVEKCFWIGPTWTSQDKTNQYGKTNARAKRVAELIAQETKGKCEFIDSTKIIAKDQIVTSSDGLHFDKINGTKWGKAAAKEIISRLQSQTAKPASSATPKSSGAN